MTDLLSRAFPGPDDPEFAAAFDQTVADYPHLDLGELIWAARKAVGRNPWTGLEERTTP